MMQYNLPYMLYFGSPNCYKCISYLTDIRRNIDLHEKNFRFINGDDLDNEETQKLCDEHGVDEYPHIKIFSEGILKYEKIGDLDVKEITNRMTTNIQVVDIRNESKSTTNKSDQSQ